MDRQIFIILFTMFINFRLVISVSFETAFYRESSKENIELPKNKSINNNNNNSK